MLSDCQCFHPLYLDIDTIRGGRPPCDLSHSDTEECVENIFTQFNQGNSSSINIMKIMMMMSMMIMLMMLMMTMLELTLTRIVTHQKYQKRNNQNDIALVFCPPLTTEQRRRVRPACLPSSGTDYSGWRESFVSGWGTRKFRGERAEGAAFKVRHVPVNDSECRAVMGGKEGMVCAGGVRGEDSCQGETVPAST